MYSLPPASTMAMRAEEIAVDGTLAFIERSFGSIRSSSPGAPPPPVDAQPFKIRSPSLVAAIPLYVANGLGGAESEPVVVGRGSRRDATIENVAGSIL